MRRVMKKYEKNVEKKKKRESREKRRTKWGEKRKKEEYKYKTMKGPLQCAPKTGPKMHSGQKKIWNSNNSFCNVYNSNQSISQSWAGYFVNLIVMRLMWKEKICGSGVHIDEVLWSGNDQWPDKRAPHWGRPGGNGSCSSSRSRTSTSASGRRCFGSGMRSICASLSQEICPSGTWGPVKSSTWWIFSPEIPGKNSLENVLVEVTRRGCSSLTRVNQHPVGVRQPPIISLVQSFQYFLDVSSSNSPMPTLVSTCWTVVQAMK